MESTNVDFLPYTATSLSVVGRFIFMFLLYRNKSANSLSLLFCMLSISSSSMWVYYSVKNNDMPMIVRSSTEISLLAISALYIIRNKVLHYQTQEQIYKTQEQIYKTQEQIYKTQEQILPS